jgi:trans-2,3-dihydro-3-hydroxyanthranilate isomerase
MKRTFPFIWVDAFTKSALGGNPCPVVFNAESLSSEEMLAITREMNQSETAFLMKSKIADLKARYFTPEREIPLAGHPTIASIHAALEEGLLKVAENITDIQLELNDGPITVRVEKNSDGTLIRMFQRKPEFFEIHNPALIVPIYGLELSDLLPGAKIQTVSTGTRQLMVPLKSHEVLKKISLQVDLYKKYRSETNFFSAHLFAMPGISADATTFARHPRVAPHTAEDAFTGSATGGMAAYLWKYGFLKEPSFIAEQGHWMGRPGRAFVQVTGSRETIETVSVAGFATTIMRGQLTL